LPKFQLQLQLSLSLTKTTLGVGQLTPHRVMNSNCLAMNDHLAMHCGASQLLMHYEPD